MQRAKIPAGIVVEGYKPGSKDGVEQSENARRVRDWPLDCVVISLTPEQAQQARSAIAKRPRAILIPAYRLVPRARLARYARSTHSSTKARLPSRGPSAQLQHGLAPELRGPVTRVWQDTQAPPESPGAVRPSARERGPHARHAAASRRSGSSGTQASKRDAAASWPAAGHAALGGATASSGGYAGPAGAA